jgi:hypothetical protein
MILSYEHSFIFIKTRKTAGTSIECFLSAYTGPNDIITPIMETHVEWHVPQNYKAESYGFKNHSTIEEVALKKPHETKDFLKISAIRNPWDKMVSTYFWEYWKQGVAPKRKFNTWLVRRSKRKIKKDLMLPYFSLHGENKIDYFIRFEHLEEDVNKLCQKIGIKFDSKFLIKTKSQSRPKNIDYRDLYNSKSRKKVESIFAKEIEEFGYKF